MIRGARVAAALAAAALAAGCGESAGEVDGGGAGDGDGAVADGAVGPDGGACGALDPAPAWLDAMLSDAVTTLATSERSSAARRGATRDWLIGELAAEGITGELHSYGMGANVVARLPGSDPTAGWILVGAHFDTVAASPGANDNATGVAAVLATARLLRDTCRRRGVIIAFFDQEEIGLIGSTYLAEAYFQGGEDLVAVHTVDQVGWDQDGDRVFEIELPSAALYTQYSQAAAALGLGVPRQTATSGTDHSAFREQGFAAAGVTEEYIGGDTTPHYHESGDTAATVSLAYTRDAVRLVSRVVAAAAQ